MNALDKALIEAIKNAMQAHRCSRHEVILWMFHLAMTDDEKETMNKPAVQWEPWHMRKALAILTRNS